MFGDRLSPFASMQQLNLDWILTKIKDMLRFLPDDGAVGQILRRTASGAEWSDESAGGVSSVNGQTGDVVLDASDIGALPDSYTAPVTSVNGQTGAVSLSIPTDTADLTNTAGYVDAAGAAAAAPVQTVNGKTGNVVATIPVLVCTTAAGTAIKEAYGFAAYNIDTIYNGLTINVYFQEANSAASPYLKLGDLLPIAPINQYGNTAAGNTSATTGWYANSFVMLTYSTTDGCWMFNKGYNTNTTYTVTDVLCTTSASTAAKTATGTYFSLSGSENKLFEITFRYANTKASKITLNIASTGTKDVWLDGSVTSASNYSIKAGHYMCLYDATNDCYQLFSNGRIMTDIIGTASGNYSSSNPPPYPVTSVNGQTGAVTISTSGVTVDTLWTNTNTAAGIAAGVLYTGDATQYDMLSVMFTGNSNSDSDNREILFFYPDGNNYNMATHNLTTGTVYLFIRNITANSTNIQISAGYRNNSTGNNYSVPIEVKGYKF